MKLTTIIAGTGLLAAAFAWSGCTKDMEATQPEIPSANTVTISLGAEKEKVNQPARSVKTIIEGNKTDGFTVKWDQADRLGVYSYAAEVPSTSLTSNTPFSISSLTDDAATFTGQIKANGTVETTFDIYAYYPYNSANTSTDYRAVMGTVPAAQTMTPAGSFDSRADYMVSKRGVQVTVTPPNVYTANVDNFQFTHLMAFTNLAVKSVSHPDVAATETVRTISLEAVALDSNPALAGDFMLNLADGSITWDASATNLVEVSVPAGMTLENLNAWAVTGPFAITPDDELIVTVTTNKHVITKTVTGKTLDFLANNIAGLNLTIDQGCTVQDLPVLLYSTGFNADEGFKSGTNYQGTATSGPAGKQWTIYYGNFTSSGNVIDGQSAQMRLYSVGTKGYLQTDFDLGKVAYVTYKARVNNANMLLETYYSVDGGAQWVQAGSDVVLTETAAEYRFDVSNTGEYDNVRIKFAVAASSKAPTSGNYQLSIDDIVVYGYQSAPPAEPEQLVMNALSSSAISAEGFTVSWNKVTAAQGYAYKLGETGALMNTTANEVIFTNLQPATTYSVYVQAVGDGVYYADSPFVSIDVTTPAKGQGKAALENSTITALPAIAYTATGTITAADATEWGYKGIFHQAKAAYLQMNNGNASGKNGYIETPIVSGSIRRVVIQTGTAASRTLRLQPVADTQSGQTVLASATTASNSTSTLEIATGDYSQLRIFSDGGTLQVKSIVVEYE